MAAHVPSRKYRIERYLAEGGMGAIYVGKKIGPGGFEKEVVLKQLLPEFTSRPEFRDLFFREAKITATLDHQNIVRTFDLVNANERLFIVMEYVRGADLRTIAWRARRRKPLSPQAIIHVALEILAGLAYAHTRCTPAGEPLRIIHRDLSPSNILCSGEGEVKLSDFGIAKAVTYSSVFYRVRGKVGYMSPEMARNQPIDARSDLFSLGVSIYETILGERIYTGDLNTPPDKIYAQQVPPLASKCPGLPAELQTVLDKALAIDPNARFADAEAFANALRQVAVAHRLLYSAPELSAELREIMGPNPDHWLGDKRDPMHPRGRAGQAANGSQDGGSLVEPGAAIDAGEDSSVENVATPPARPSGSLPTAHRPSGQGPAASSQSWEAMPAISQPAMPAVSQSAMPAVSQSSTAPSAAKVPASAPGTGRVGSDAPVEPPVPVEPPQVRPGSAFRRFHLSRPAGGVAAARPTYRNLWLGALLVLAVLLGFAFVRFFLTAAVPRTAPTGARAIPVESSIAADRRVPTLGGRDV